MTTETQTATDTPNDKPARPNAAHGQPHTVSNPNDVARLVLLQIERVNTKKDELTIATKTLSDTAKQLVRAYAEQATVIARLQQRVKALEEKPEAGNATAN
jgi:hypothetical protein